MLQFLPLILSCFTCFLTSTMANAEALTSTNPSTIDPYPVYTGIWTNWSHGKIMGATLTLGRRDADLLIAFTAFFIAFISTRTWRILCFCFHRLFSTSSPQDIVYHQRQAILRNSSSPEDSIYWFWQLLWAVRHSKRFVRILPIIVTAVSCMTAFTLAGGFSSRLSTGVGNEVLISSANCGAANIPNISEDINTSYAFRPYCAKKITDAANYARRCYTVNAGADCSSFVTPRLQSIQDLNASCPFSEPMCRRQSGNIRLDSGYVDSHKHLGLNSPPGRRILWRHVVHCAPLVTEGFTSQEDNSQASTRYHYGSVTVRDGDVDYIYKAPSLESQYSDVLSEDNFVSHGNHKIQ